jgi:ADP-heptose:LPS heptosyltransferase/lauroyl/myristoyl acyltransferase
MMRSSNIEVPAVEESAFNRRSPPFDEVSVSKSNANPALVLKLLLKTLGWLIAHAPEPALAAVAVILGDGIFFLSARRRRLILSNLHHAFPEKDAAWQRRIGRESCRRLIETGLLSFATPFLSERRLRKIIRPTPELLAGYALQQSSPAPTLICSPHLAYWEAQTSMSLVVPGAFPEFGTIFRPLDNAAADEWVRRSRERFGMRLLSRREGFAEALKILRRKGFVGVLFDQNAGMQGALTTLFGRVCSTTELPGLMAEKFQARVYGIFSRRLGFWRVEVSLAPIAHDNTTAGVTVALNRWLETLLRADDNLCASWLWAHDRWRHQDIPERRLRLESKRDLLAASEPGALPRRTRIWIRLPNWLGDVVMALPLLRALRVSRPDAEITLLAQPQFLPLLENWNVADHLRALPRRGGNYFLSFWRARRDYPDAYLLFTNSFRGDLEAWLTRCPQRFGLVRPGKHRPLLTHRYHVPADFDEAHHHQLELWDNFLRHFGLNAPPDRTPVAQPSPGSGTASIGLIAGSENTPEKRWPVAHWRSLIEALPDRHFILFGTAGDRAITTAIAAGFPETRVTDLAGRTHLPGFVEQLRQCTLLVTNDTGGMHLANAVGVPLVALFGPTNPLRTGPVFSAPTDLLQPPGCPPSGGGSLQDLAPTAVGAAVRHRLAASR